MKQVARDDDVDQRRDARAVYNILTFQIRTKLEVPLILAGRDQKQTIIRKDFLLFGLPTGD